MLQKMSFLTNFLPEHKETSNFNALFFLILILLNLHSIIIQYIKR